MQDQALLDQLITIARQAGAAISEVYHSDNFEIDIKSDNSPLTIADQRSHEVINEALVKLDMGPVLSEEGKHAAFEQRQTWDQYWLIDPLDGTKEFIKRNGEFTVNIALIRHGTAIAGVVLAPEKSLLYYGSVELGAFKQVGDGEPEKISVRRPPEDPSQWKVVGSRSHASPEFEAFVKKLPGAEIVSMGSSLKLCLVADGSADLYPRLGPTSEWDTAAAQAVVESAGGMVLEYSDSKAGLKPLQYNQKDSLLNPYFIVCAKVSDQWAQD